MRDFQRTASIAASAAMRNTCFVATSAVEWGLANRKKAIVLFAAMMAAIVLIGSGIHPERAYAADSDILNNLLGAVAGVGGQILGDIAFDTATSTLEDFLKGALNGLLSMSTALLSNAARGTLLTASFDSLLGEGADVSETLMQLHEGTAVPLGNLTLLILLVFGMMKLVSKIGTTESGLDTWQLVWLLVMFGFAKVAVDSSWELMMLGYDVMHQFVTMTLQTPEAVFEVTGAGEDVKNAGILLAMIVMAMIMLIGNLVVCAGTYLVVMVRNIQIYLYTVFAPIPLACMVSEGGREVTKNFVKKYVALLLTGVIIALFYVMMGIVTSSIGTPSTEVTDPSSLGTWALECLMSMMVYGAFVWAMFKSGTWARDIVGA